MVKPTQKKMNVGMETKMYVRGVWYDNCFITILLEIRYCFLPFLLVLIQSITFHGGGKNEKGAEVYSE